jgi:hypothetical protein
MSNVYFVLFENHSNRLYYIKKCCTSLDVAIALCKQLSSEYEHEELKPCDLQYMGLQYLYECYFQHPKYFGKSCFAIAVHKLIDCSLDDLEEACPGQRMC